MFFWLIDTIDRTAVNSLHASWNAIKCADQIFLVKNLRNGNNFEFFDGSTTIRNIMSENNVRTVIMPKFASRIVKNLRIDRMTWEEIATITPTANRVEGQRLRSLFHATFKTAGI